MKKFQITIDSYELCYSQGFLDTIKCLVFVKGILGESREVSVNIEDFAHFIDEENVSDYFKEESLETIEAALETFINKMEGRTEIFSTEEPEFPETILN